MLILNRLGIGQPAMISLSSLIKQIFLWILISTVFEHVAGKQFNEIRNSEPILPPPIPVFYEFAYKVKSPEHGTDFGHSESKVGHVTSGEYRVLLPDGRLQIVTYSVTKDSGYVANVRYE